MKPLIDEDAENMLWDENYLGEDSLPDGDLTTSSGRDDQETSVSTTLPVHVVHVLGFWMYVSVIIVK